jgi:hypothetical protein
MQVPLPPDISKMSEIWPFMKDLLQIVVVPYLVWNYKINKEMNDKLDKNRESTKQEISSLSTAISTVNTTLIGQDGKNGLRSRFIRIEKRVEGIMLGMSRAGMNIRIEDLKDGEE